MNTTPNQRGPGQPKLPYQTKTVRIPVALEDKVRRMVEQYKAQHKGS